MLISGALTVKMRDMVLGLYCEIPEPKAVGRLCHGQPLDAYIPVDENVPGCPTHPQAIVAGIGKGVILILR